MGKRNDLEKVVKDVEETSKDFDYEDVDKLSESFQEIVKTDPKYSLNIDPLGEYNFSEKENDIISYMIQYKNVQFVTTVLMNIPLEEGVDMYKSYNIQKEIKRINLAMYARRFATKMASLDEVGGFLTSGLIDENVPVAERWGPKEKLTASKLLINLNMLKKKAVNHPQVVETVEIQKDLQKLNPNELKQLIELNEEGNEEKEKLIAIINEDNLLSMEELKNLRMMDIDELRDLVESITEGELEDENEED